MRYCNLQMKHYKFDEDRIKYKSVPLNNIAATSEAVSLIPITNILKIQIILTMINAILLDIYLF